VEQQFVIFHLAEEQYGLEISSVEGIIRLQEIKNIPRSPDYIEGIIHLRGIIVPVIDLRRRFGLPQVKPTKDTRMVVIYMGKTQVGLIVDDVSEVIRVPEDAVEPPPSMVAGADTAFIRGIAKFENRLITLLNHARILNQNEQAAVEHIAG
jgi:purine-binding chemotaxis protein CheW